VLVEATDESLVRVSTYYEPLNDRLRSHLTDLDDDLLDVLLRFAAAAEESIDAEIRPSGAEQLSGR
jgi:hypothetical protein